MESPSAPTIDLVLLKRAFLRLLPMSEEVTASMVMSLESQGLVPACADRDEFHLSIWLALAKALDQQLKTPGAIASDRRISLALYGLGVPLDRMAEASDVLSRSLGDGESEVRAWSEFLTDQLTPSLSNPIK